MSEPHTHEELGLPQERQGRRAPADLLERRRGFRALADLQIGDPIATVQTRTIADVECIEIAGQTPRGAMVYAHGGGFRLGEASVWAGLASRIAAATGLRIILPDYRLAPENPFPNGLRDLARVYSVICATTPDPVFIGGDSAGGGLACSVIVNSLAEGARIPAGAVLFSPWLDLAVSAQSFTTNALTDTALSRESATEMVEGYLQGVSPEETYASPLRADMKGFPPVLVFASASEVLVDDTIRLIERLARAGVRVVAHVIPGMPHVWPIMVPSAPETAAAIDAFGWFVGTLLEHPSLPPGTNLVGDGG